MTALRILGFLAGGLFIALALLLFAATTSAGGGAASAGVLLAVLPLALGAGLVFAAAKAGSRPCPRCGVGVKRGSTVCPTCDFDFSTQFRSA